MIEYTIVIDGDKAEAIFDDGLVEVLGSMGQVSHRRASHVEPCGDKWTADMSPVGGPVLGPYDLRRTALEHEVAWLKENLNL